MSYRSPPRNMSELTSHNCSDISSCLIQHTSTNRPSTLTTTYHSTSHTTQPAHHTHLTPTMSDWDQVTKIGSKARGGAAGPRETVIKGKSALNAAQRSGGIVATEKKFATANVRQVPSPVLLWHKQLTHVTGSQQGYRRPALDQGRPQRGHCRNKEGSG